MLSQPCHHVTPDGINLEWCLKKRDCILHTSSLALQKNLRPWRREWGVQRKEHVMLWVSNGKSCPGWLSDPREGLSRTQDCGCSSLVLPQNGYDCTFGGSWSPFRGEKNILHLYKIKTNVCVFSFLLLLMITPFYLNSFKITAKLVIAIKLF